MKIETPKASLNADIPRTGKSTWISGDSICPTSIAQELTAKPVNVPKFMTVESAFNDPSCIIHARGDEPCTTRDRGQASTQYDSTNSVYAVHYQPPKRLDKQVEGRYAMKQLDGNATVNWRDELQMPNERIAYCQWFVYIPTQFDNMWDVQVGASDVVQHLVDLEQSMDLQILSDTYWADHKAKNSRSRTPKVC